MTADPEAEARAICAGTMYMTLATADANGRPWATPVYAALDDPAELLWVSRPETRHSQNIAARPRIAMVVFDSTVAPGTGQAVYMTATAGQVTDAAALASGLGVVSGVSRRQGAREFGVDDVTGDARLRLYRADVHEHSILDPSSPFDVRVEVRL